MGIFGPPRPDPFAPRTFQASVPGRAARTDRRGIAALIVAATSADKAEHELAALKAAYASAPTPELLRKLRLAAAYALDKEVAFDALWEEMSREWFDRPRERSP